MKRERISWSQPKENVKGATICLCKFKIEF